jgi:hypothetical protein
MQSKLPNVGWLMKGLMMKKVKTHWAVRHSPFINDMAFAERTQEVEQVFATEPEANLRAMEIALTVQLDKYATHVQVVEVETHEEVIAQYTKEGVQSQLTITRHPGGSGGLD